MAKGFGTPRQYENALPPYIERWINSVTRVDEEGLEGYRNCYIVAAKEVLERGGTMREAELAVRKVHRRITCLGCLPPTYELLPGTSYAYNDDKLVLHSCLADEDNPNCEPIAFYREEDDESSEDE